MYKATPLTNPGPFPFNTHKDEVYKVLGEPDTYIEERKTCFYQNIRVYFDRDCRVNAVEYFDPGICSVNGCDLLNVPVSKAKYVLGELGTLEAETHEFGYSYMYLDIQTTLWRDDKHKRTFDSLLLGRPYYYDSIISLIKDDKKKPKKIFTFTFV